MDTTTWSPLPPDMSQWSNAVLENLAQRVPEATQYIYGLEWSNLDPASGTGDGIIQLLNGMCAVPVKIADNRLAPLDVVVSNYGSEPKFYPLTANFLQKIYADNVIGQPVQKGAHEDEDYLGPAFKVKHIRTVDNLKYASKTAAENLMTMITKSAAVSNWMLENMPDVITAINDKLTEQEKVASESIELPELMVAWKDGENYYANGNIVDVDTISDFCKVANVTEEEKTAFMSGTPIIRDFREKVANIHIPTEQEIVAMDIEDTSIFDTGGEVARPLQERFPDICITNAYLKDGTSQRGVIFSENKLHQTPPQSTVKNPNPQDIDPSIIPEDYYETHKLELFVCDEGYSLNYNIKTDARIALPGSTIAKVSTPTEPSIGMVGIVLEVFDSAVYVSCFGRIEDITSAGSVKWYRMYDYINHTMASVKIHPDMHFYEVVDNRLATASAYERTSFVSSTGLNGVLIKNSDGKFVIDGTSYSSLNIPYALMSKYAAAYNDAVKIANIANKCGKCEFEVLLDTEAINKIATTVTVKTDEEDTTKTKAKDNKNTKTGTDDESRPAGTVSQQLAGVTPEQLFSITPDMLGNTSAGIGAGQASNNTAGNGIQGGYTDPVTTNDLENAVQVNSPKAMDAYMMSTLIGDQSASQDNIMCASDAIVEALEHLSKMLFLARQGQLDFISEQDIQAASKKLNDILSNIGMQPTRVGQ